MTNETLNVIASYVAYMDPIETAYAFHYERNDAKKIFDVLKKMVMKAYDENSKSTEDIEVYTFYKIDRQGYSIKDIIMEMDDFLWECGASSITSSDEFKGLDQLCGHLARGELRHAYDE